VSSAGTRQANISNGPKNDVAEAIIEAIDRPRQADDMSRGADGWLPTLDLPGFGDSYDSCGEDMPHFCEDCGHTFAVGRTCSRSVCPRCAQSWVTNRAPNIVGKLDATARMMASVRDGAVYKHHVVLSPPDDWYLEAEDPLDRTFRVVREILDVMDAQGMVAYHPWAGEGSDGDDRGEWKRRLFNGRDWEDVVDELVARGHFHAVVASPHIPGGDVTKQVHEETGWVIKRVTKRDGSARSLSDLQDVARAVSYVLSHTGIDTDRDGHNQAAYRKFGATWHDADVYDDVEEAADRAVREVAPKTLGIETRKVRCEREVAAEARDSDGSVDLLKEFGDGQGSGADAEPEPSTAEPDDGGEMVPCSGRVRDIEDAPDYLDDDVWVATASCADELREAWADWEPGDGWPGG
jgi:hypothetical protein